MFKTNSGMIGKKTILATAVAAAALCLGSRVASADTIDVNSIGLPAVDGTGVIYQYDIAFDDKAVVQTSDGFVVTNFGPQSSIAAIALTPGTSGDLPTELAWAADLSLHYVAPASGLSSYVSNNGTQSTFTNGGGSITEADSSTIGDLEFLDTTPFSATLGHPEDLILTVITNTIGDYTVGSGIGVDHSGVAGAALTSSYAGVYVPSANPTVGTPPTSPLPLTSLGGGVLFGLAGMMRFLKLRPAR